MCSCNVTGSAFFHYRMHIVCALLLLDCLVLAQSSSALNKMWDEWKIKHRKVYDNQVGLREPPSALSSHVKVQGFTRCSPFVFQTEVVFRRAVWEKNVQLVLRHNQEASAGKHSFTMGLNHLADMVGIKPVVWTF